MALNSFPVGFPEQLKTPYYLAMGDFDRFGVVFFREAYGPNKDAVDSPERLASHMMATPKPIRGEQSVEEAVKLLPSSALKPGDVLYALDGRGAPFYVSVHPETGKVNVQSGEMTAAFKNLELSAQRQTLNRLADCAIHQRNEETLVFLDKQSGLVTHHPVISLNQNPEDFQWICSKPDVLSRIGKSCSYLKESSPELISAIEKWPSQHIEGFFREPRQYGHELSLIQLEDMGMLMSPKTIPTVVKAGILPEAERYGYYRDTPAYAAFRKEEANLMGAFESKEAVEKLLVYRRAGSNESIRQQLEGMEAHLADYMAEQGSKTSLPAIPNLSGQKQSVAGVVSPSRGITR